MTKQNNQLAHIRGICDGWQGKNYGFNDCAAYVMECLDEPDYDYWFFAGITGDNMAQIFSRDRFRGVGVSDFLQGDGDHSYAVKIFNACGYDADFIPETVLRANPESYLQRLMEYIDRGIPVIRYWCGWHVCVGYEDGGHTLLCMTDNNKEPYRVTAQELFEGGQEHKHSFPWFGWIFVGEKKEQKDLRQLYRDAIYNLPKLLTTKTEGYCFGAGAFRAWADEINSGKYDDMKPEEFDAWAMHTNYVCCMATNSGGSQYFIRKALELNPDLTFLEDVCRQYRITGLLWDKGDIGWYLYDCPKKCGKPCRSDQGCRNCKQLTAAQAEDEKRYRRVKDLEKLGGGFNIKLKTLKNPRKRAKIMANIRKCADGMDEVVRLLEQNLR